MFHAKAVEEIFRELKTDKNGLSSSRAGSILKENGPNELRETGNISPLKIFFLQFRSFIVGILIFATVIAALLREWVDTIVILIILILNAVLGFIQEYRAEKAIEALKKMAAPKAKVMRDGKIVKIFAKDVVGGDIIMLETGDKVPADARLIEAFNLEIQEASLTGESNPVKKETGVLKQDTVIAERRNMVFSSTIVTKGRATAVVIATGMKTEIGKVARMVGETKREPTPLQKKLSSLGKILGIVVIIIAVVSFFVGFLLKEATLFDMLLTSISLAVAAIPEGLPAIVTIALAIGIQRMVRKNALMRRLPSVETLGDTTVVCTDKTGTLTKNEMTVKKIFANSSFIEVSGEGYSVDGKLTSNGKPVNTKNMELLLQTGVLCNDSKIKPQLVGDPTEIALIVSAEKGGLNSTGIFSKFKRIDELPFDSARKMMSTLNYNGKEHFIFTTGAVESVLKSSTKILENGRTRKITESDRKKILEANQKFAEGALRVLAFAYRPCKKEKIKENEMIFIGLQAMIDPPREDAKIAMQRCENAGIKVIMITGDHEVTAKAIGRAFGLAGRVVNGKELEKTSVERLRQIVTETSIFARVNPEHKLKIVQALQANGNVVAMTGDGVNDAPALKKADIGIAMGISGTDVAKEASDMILVDDNFASIVNAVEEGRGIFENIKKFVEYLVSSNIGEVLTIFGGIIIGAIMNFPLPLLALQILWINLVTDGLPALALGIEKHDKAVMEEKPRKRSEGVITKKSFIRMFFSGAIMMAGTLAVLYYFLPDERYARTAAFSCLVFFQMFNVLNCKSEKKSVFTNLFSNWSLIAAVAVSVALQIAVTYPPLSNFFSTTPLKFYDWIFITAVASSVFIYRELQKVMQK